LWGLYLSAIEIKLPKDSHDDVKIKKEEGDHISSLSDLEEEEESGDNEDISSENETKHKKRYRSDLAELQRYPPLLISLLFSYLGLITLKHPVTINELFKYPHHIETLTKKLDKVRGITLLSCL
jgi:hypothetical protein